MEIPKENLDKLKCSHCNKYLSCFPIKLTNENRSFCGRCSTNALLKDENSLHVTTYELLAKYMRFPCSFDGCLATLLPSEVVQHELSCLYKTIDCFLQNDCNFDGNRDEFYEHCNDVHQRLILKNFEFEVDAIATYEQNNLLKYENEFFVIKRRYDKPTNTLTCSIVGIDNIIAYNYQIIIRNGKRDKSIEFAIKSVENFTKNPNNLTEIVIDQVSQQLNHPSVLIASIKIIENYNDDGNGAHQLQHDLLKELECPVCFEYMFPPIKLCETGHSICSNCLESIQQCPLCRSSFKINQRNITLESMANRLNFPCKYNERGCFFISNMTRIRQHLEFCKYAPKKCLLHDYVDCKWTGLEKQLFAHITAQHHDNTVDNNQIDTYINDNFFNEEFRCCYILNFFGRLFKLHHLYKENRFYWAMQFNDPMLDNNKNQCFKYEIDFIDNNGNDQKMTFRDLCTSLKTKTDCFRDGDRFVIVESSQIKRFLADNTLSYRIHIIKY